MVKTYSRRLFSPFTSALQVADTDDARAFSLDGRHWEIQYRIASAMEAKLGQAATDPDLGFARVASVSEAGVEHLPSHPLIDTPMVDSALEQLGPCLVESRLPFEAIDHWEYWLLDELEEKPLVLLSACVDRAEVDAHPELTEWSAMPAAQLAIEDPDASETEYVPPVNDRLQKRVAARAGRYPKALWVQRIPGDEDGFPPCLLRETWDDPGDQELCRLYIERLAPRLLMMQGLPRNDRTRLEQAARTQALEVERFYPLYPEIVDQKLMTSLRVEAQLRRAAEPRSP